MVCFEIPAFTVCTALSASPFLLILANAKNDRIAVLKDSNALKQLHEDDTNVFQKSLLTDISIGHVSFSPCVWQNSLQPLLSTLTLVSVSRNGPE